MGFVQLSGQRSQSKFVNLRLLKSYQAYFDYNVVRLEFNYKEKNYKKHTNMKSKQYATKQPMCHGKNQR